MTNCNKPTFPLICNNADFSDTFHNTGEQIYYQKIDPVHASHVDGVVLLERNGNYYKAIYTENTINIEWYRCRYRDPLINNDEAMITQAVKTAAYLGATLRFDAREYIVNKQLEFQNLSCFKLLGDKQHTLIKSSTTERFWSYYLKFVNCNNFIIDGIKIDQNKSHISQIYTEADYNNAGSDDTLRDFNGGIYITFIQDRYTGGTINIEIKNCSFLDLYTRGLQFYNCYKDGEIKITGNYFESGVQNQMYRMEHLALLQSHNVNFIVENNVFRNEPPKDVNGNPLPPNPAKMPSGLSAFDCGYLSSIIVNNNIFEYCGRNNEGHHRLFAIDFYDNVNNFMISNNIFRNATWGAIRFDGTKKNAVITDNYIHQLIPNSDGIIDASSKTVGTPYENTFKNISICNNIIEAVSNGAYGISLQSQHDSVTAENINILNNTFHHLRTAVVIGGNIMGVNISNNNASDMFGPVVEYSAYSTTITINPDGSTTTTKRLTSALGNALISNNNFKSAPQANSFVGVSIKSYTPTEGEVERVNELTNRFVISNNLIYGNGNSLGVVTDITTATIPIGTSLDGKVTVSGNEISNVGIGLYLRVHKTIAKENILFNCSVQPLMEGYTDNIKFNNYYNNIPV